MPPDFDVDTAMANIEQTGSVEGIPAEHNEPSTVASTEPTTPEQQFLEYVARGKTIKEPIDMVLKRASMGYDYAQRMNELKTQMSEIEGIRKQNEELSRWREYDEFAKKNPEWAQHVQQTWENRQGIGQENPEVSALKTQLSQMQQKFEEVNKFISSQQQAKEDQALTQEIESIRQRYTDIDFQTPDESGKSLEWKVLEHAQQHGIRSFKTAFHDFYHDHLATMRESAAKESAVKQNQMLRKQGIMGVSDKPQSKKNPDSWMEDLGIDLSL